MKKYFLLFILPLLTIFGQDKPKLIGGIEFCRNAKVLARLRRREVLEGLIEMARWRTGHAEPARYILGCVAGVDEARLKRLIAAGRVEPITNELRSR